jgi:DNA polymerase elongation subunit (family B)
MTRRPPVYGLDIETDTTENALDPRVAPVVTVALSREGGDEIFRGREPTLLFDLDQRLQSLEPGVIATWNGSTFDLPFLARRAAYHRLDLGLRLSRDAHLDPRRGPAALRRAYRGAWYHHSHLDAYRLYRGDVGPALRVSGSLKSIARLVGLAPLEVDNPRNHDLSREALHAYAPSDARLARVLTQRRMPGAIRFVDRLDEADAASA